MKYQDLKINWTNKLMENIIETRADLELFGCEDTEAIRANQPDAAQVWREANWKLKP